jgi:hypothetical protein
VTHDAEPLKQLKHQQMKTKQQASHRLLWMVDDCNGNLCAESLSFKLLMQSNSEMAGTDSVKEPP